MRSKLTEWERFKVLKILSENRWFSENSLPVNVLKNDSFSYVSTDFGHFYGDKTNWKNWQVFRCFNRFWPFFWLQNPLTKIDNFSDVSTYFSQFSCDKTHWKMIDSFQMFQQILAILLATKPIEKAWQFLRCFTRFWTFF